MDNERYEEGCVLLELGKLDRAKEIFMNIIEEDSSCFQALNKIGVIYAERGNLEEAQEYFEQALDIKKDYAPALVNIGNILKEYGEDLEAERFYLAAVSEDPDYANAYHNLAIIYKERNQYDIYMKYIKEYKRVYRRQSYSREGRQKRAGNRKIGMFVNLTLIISLSAIILVLVSNK